MVKSSVHIDPKIINLNIEKPGYQAIQEKCEKSDDVILNSGTGVPLYVQATKIPSNDEVYNWQCSSMYDGPVLIYNISLYKITRILIGHAVVINQLPIRANNIFCFYQNQ